jgi:hypothetical protein
MKRRLLLMLVFLTCAAVLCAVLLRWRASARPWYFDEEQCKARLLGKTPQEVEAAIGARPNCFGRPWREQPELDSHFWRLGTSAYAAWHFEWGSIFVEYDKQERSVTANVTWYQPGPFEKGTIEVSRQ